MDYIDTAIIIILHLKVDSDMLIIYYGKIIIYKIMNHFYNFVYPNRIYSFKILNGFRILSKFFNQ